MRAVHPVTGCETRGKDPDRDRDRLESSVGLYNFRYSVESAPPSTIHAHPPKPLNPSSLSFIFKAPAR